MPEVKRYKMGCIRDTPNPLDRRMMATREQTEALPPSVILNDTTGVEDQGQIGSCTGNGGDNASKIRSLIATGSFFNGSRLALYKWARDHDGTTGDAGSHLSSMAWVLANKGVPPETHWPYDISQFDVEPPPNVAADAAKDETTKETRLDDPDEQVTINNIKVALNSGYPVMLGITCYESIFSVGADGNIPMPSRKDPVAGGHAICIVGYDDNHVNAEGTKGALKMKNSWGTGWGAQGYGWISYNYALKTNDAVGDCWAILAESDFPTSAPTPS